MLSIPVFKTSGFNQWKNSENVVLKQDVETGCFKYGVYTTFNPCKK
jgi:hypothetical protein